MAFLTRPQYVQLVGETTRLRIRRGGTRIIRQQAAPVSSDSVLRLSLVTRDSGKKGHVFAIRVDHDA